MNHKKALPRKGEVPGGCRSVFFTPTSTNVIHETFWSNTL